LFVHPNIANLVVHTDLNMLSALQYAVELLEVKHVIVCGHYRCGVEHAMGRSDLGLINKWLRHIKDVYRLQLESIADTNARWDRLLEINVTEQVQNLAQTSIIQRAWHKQRGPSLHGWVYDLCSGYLRRSLLCRRTRRSTISTGSSLDRIAPSNHPASMHGEGLVYPSGESTVSNGGDAAILLWGAADAGFFFAMVCASAMYSAEESASVARQKISQKS
jgi:hypothetical protein